MTGPLEHHVFGASEVVQVASSDIHGYHPVELRLAGEEERRRIDGVTLSSKIWAASTFYETEPGSMPRR